MNRQQNQRSITGTVLWILLILAVVISLIIGFRFFQLSQYIPGTDGLQQAISEIYPFDPESEFSDDSEIELPIDTELEFQIIVDTLEKRASHLNFEYLILSDQIERLQSLVSSLIYTHLFLLIILLMSLGLGIYQTRKHDLLIGDYRNLRSQYQKLLGSKKIIDAELRAAREYISELEKRMQGK